jgi:hypothetical protein
MRKDVASGSVGVAPGSAESVALGSVEVAPDSAGVAPCSAEDAAPCSEENAGLNPALNSVAVSASDLLLMDSQWPTTRLVEDVLLVGAEGIWGGGEGCKGGSGSGRRASKVPGASEA